MTSLQTLAIIVPNLAVVQAAYKNPLTSTAALEQIGSATLSQTIYRGKQSVVLNEELDPNFGDLAVVKGLDFHNGMIDLDITAELTPNAPRGARGFVGIAFRGTDDLKSYENFYLRMTNGRAPNEELRNHAAQYCSVPNFTWDTLRKRKPGKYEARADLEVGAWTHIQIKVQGAEAKFFVGHAKKPTLTVHGLMMGDTHGKIALWVAGYTKGHFANLRVEPRQ